METLSRNLQSLRQSMAEVSFAAGRAVPPDLIAVGKSQTPERMLELYRAGQRDFGENYVQELLAKVREFHAAGAHEARFHFIGKLQSNKVKALLPAVHAIHSVDSLKLLREIDRVARLQGRRVPVFFQVNIDHEPSKSGFAPEDLPGLASSIGEFPSILPSGLMAIPDPALPPEAAFRRMGRLSEAHGADLGTGLSMGMSNDWRAAIAFGATHVRLGTALFGPRRE